MSFRHPDQLGLAIEFAQSFAVDNGAFSAWKSGEPVEDWQPFYDWVAALRRIPNFDFAVIPDEIDSTEAENDALLDEWPWGHAGAPVWHLHESLGRLERLAYEWPRVCLGSSSRFATIGTASWWNRMAEAMNVVCDSQGLPVCKIHGLRMLDSRVFSRFPFASADSTNIARNIGIDAKWRGTYTPPSKECRAQVMRERIEAHQAAVRWDRQAMPVQAEMEWVA